MSIGRFLRRFIGYQSISMVSAISVFFGAQVSQGFAGPPHPKKQSSEDWAWGRIVAGNEANFNTRCGTDELDPSSGDDRLWADNCRRLSGEFLAKALTDPVRRVQLPRSG